MERIPVVEAKAHFSEVLARVESGREILITRRGHAVARMSAVERAKKPIHLSAIDAFRDSLPAQKRKSVDLIRAMRDGSY